MLSAILVAVGVLWITLGLSKTTGFKFNNVWVERFLCAGFFVFGLFQVALGIFLLIAPTPFGSASTVVVNGTINATPYLVNTTSYLYNATNNITSTTISQNLVLNQTSSKTYNYTYSVFGSEILTFLSYAYFLIVFIYLFLWAVDMWDYANQKMSGRRGRDDTA